jgi:signal transduction histidine kinase
MTTSFRFTHLLDFFLRTSASTEPSGLNTSRTYIAISVIFGLFNIAFPIIASGNQLPLQDIPFILLAPLYCATLPLFPRLSAIAYSGCWLTLIIAPDVYISDMVFTNWLFHFLIGRFLPTHKAAAVHLVNGIAYAVVTFTAYVNITGKEVTLLAIYLLSGILFIPAGAIARKTEHFWRNRAHITEQRLNSIRDDIATEMHDLVAYSMSQTVLRARLAAENKTYPEEAREEFSGLAVTGSDALHELRLLLYTLKRRSDNPLSSDETTFLKPSHDIVTSIRLVTRDLEDAGFEVNCYISENIGLSRAQTLILSRIAREMGANIIRHGDASSPASFLLSQNKQRIQLLSTNAVSNDHIIPMPSSGTGIMSMQERLAALGGALMASNEDGTWITSASIPVVEVEE